jgi:nucleoid-associated protein YgaU
MRALCASLLLSTVLLSAGCGYVHFGRLPKTPIGTSDSVMATAYTELATEHKILKQELALTRKEGDALRQALERSGGAAPSITVAAETTSKLSETTRELAALRTSYAKLQAERAGNGAAATAAKAELEEKLADSLRKYTQLQEENSRLRGEVDRTRAENNTLASQLKTAAMQAERAEATMAQLNGDLIAQKEARMRAEQAADAVRTQLTTVLAHRDSTPVTAPRPAAPGALSSLQIAKAPPAELSPTAELRVSADQLRSTPPAAAPVPPATSAAANTQPPMRIHVVKAGDTLEKISRQYFNAPDRWKTIYDANVDVLGKGDPLRAGMELRIPVN